MILALAYHETKQIGLLCLTDFIFSSSVESTAALWKIDASFLVLFLLKIHVRNSEPRDREA